MDKTNRYEGVDDNNNVYLYKIGRKYLKIVFPQIENNNYHMTIITTICLLQSAILNVCKRFKKIDFILFISKHSLYICSSLSPFLPPPLRPFSDQL